MQLVRVYCKKNLQWIKVFPLLVACSMLTTAFVSAQDEIIDFEYIPDKNLLIVPTLVGNKLLAFELALD